MIKYIFFISLLYSSTISAQISNYSEKEISDYIQSLIGGEREVSVRSGRIDLVHNDVLSRLIGQTNGKSQSDKHYGMHNSQTRSQE